MSNSDLRTNHEEADIIIVQHVIDDTTEYGSSNSRVISDDTDVFILLIYFYIALSMNIKLTMAWNPQETSER